MMHIIVCMNAYYMAMGVVVYSLVVKLYIGYEVNTVKSYINRIKGILLISGH